MYGPRATQVSRLLAELPALGWRPTTICLAPRRAGSHWFNGAGAEPPRGVELVRVPSPEEWTPLRAAWRVAPSLRDRPDRSRVWVPGATRAAIRVADRDAVAGVITFAQPWSDHLVGLRVSRTAGVPWVAHFSDPWADSPYATARQRSIWRRMEEDVVREASALVFVAKETADLTMAKYPEEWRKKVSIVPHGFDPHVAADAATRQHQPNRPLRLVYTGRFYSAIRTPTSLLRALAALNAREPVAGALEVTFIGPHIDEFRPDAAALGVDAFVRFRDRVPPAEAARAAADADVLLVIDAPSERPSVFLPSKLVDYLPFRKPILGLTPEPGAAACLLRRLGCPVAPPEDVPGIASAVADLLRRHRDGALDVGAAFDAVAAEYDIRRTARLLHDVMIRAFG